jgi:hypothetical protein
MLKVSFSAGKDLYFNETKSTKKPYDGSADSIDPL